MLICKRECPEQIAADPVGTIFTLGMATPGETFQLPDSTRLRPPMPSTANETMCSPAATEACSAVPTRVGSSIVVLAADGPASIEFRTQVRHTIWPQLRLTTANHLVGPSPDSISITPLAPLAITDPGRPTASVAEDSTEEAGSMEVGVDVETQ
jgi:hypothetical protein